MRKFVAPILIAATLSACGSTGGVFSRARPDELAVARAAPLVVPPDFALRPPVPGAPRPQEADSSTLALASDVRRTCSAQQCRERGAERRRRRARRSGHPLDGGRSRTRRSSTRAPRRATSSPRPPVRRSGRAGDDAAVIAKRRGQRRAVPRVQKAAVSEATIPPFAAFLPDGVGKVVLVSTYDTPSVSAFHVTVAPRLQSR